MTVQPTSLENSVDYYSVDYNIVGDPAVLMERTVANSADLTDLTASVGYEVVVKAVAGLGGDRVESASVRDIFTLSTALQILISSTKIKSDHKVWKKKAFWMRDMWGG